MTDKERLLHTLFEAKGKEHLNLKFFRGISDDISPEDLCREACSAIFQAEQGLAATKSDFGDRGRKTVDVKELHY